MISNVAWFLLGSPLNPKQERCRVRASDLFTPPALALTKPLANFLYERRMFSKAKERERDLQEWVFLCPIIYKQLSKFVTINALMRIQNNTLISWPLVTKTSITFCSKLQMTWNHNHWILHSKGYRINRSFAQNDQRFPVQIHIQNRLKFCHEFASWIFICFDFFTFFSFAKYILGCIK